MPKEFGDITQQLQSTPTLFLFVCCTLFMIFSFLLYLVFRKYTVGRYGAIVAFGFLFYVVHLNSGAIFDTLDQNRFYSTFFNNLSVDVLGSFAIPIIIVSYYSYQGKPLFATTIAGLIGTLLLGLGVLGCFISLQMLNINIKMGGTTPSPLTELVDYSTLLNLGVDVIAGILLAMILIAGRNFGTVFGPLLGQQMRLHPYLMPLLMVVQIIPMLVAVYAVHHLHLRNAGILQSLKMSALGAMVSIFLIEITLNIMPDQRLLVITALGFVVLGLMGIMVVDPELADGHVWQSIAPEILGSFCGVLLLEGDHSHEKHLSRLQLAYEPYL